MFEYVDDKVNLYDESLLTYFSSWYFLHDMFPLCGFALLLYKRLHKPITLTAWKMK